MKNNMDKLTDFFGTVAMGVLWVTISIALFVLILGVYSASTH